MYGPIFDWDTGKILNIDEKCVQFTSLDFLYKRSEAFWLDWLIQVETKFSRTQCENGRNCVENIDDCDPSDNADCTIVAWNVAGDKLNVTGRSR